MKLRLRWTVLATAVVLALGAAVLDRWLEAQGQRRALLRAEPGQILHDPRAMNYARTLARPLYARHCASCHGGSFEGNAARGVPNLASNVWLYGNDPIDVERTILYGIRSGHPKSRNVTDMPGLVRSGQITADDDRDVVEHLLRLSGQPHDDAAAQRGRAIYDNKGVCYDCHANDAAGVTDYGAPALTGPHWLYGGDRATLYRSIYYGRHGRCPAWINLLKPVQVRALTLFLLDSTAPVPAAVAAN